MSKLTYEQALVRLYTKAEISLIKTIKKKAMYGNATTYERSLLRQVDEQIKKLRQSSDKLIQQMVKKNYKSGLEQLVNSLSTDKNAPKSYNLMSGLNTNQINIIVDNLTQQLNFATANVGRRCNDLIRQATLEATAKKLTTGQTVREMQKELAKRLLSENVTSIKYSNGTEHNIKDYASMVSRTTTAETQNIAQFVQGKDWGYDLVRMTSHSPTCEICAMYQGRVYATTKEAANGKYKDKNGNILRFAYLYDTVLVDGYNTVHPNCRHRFSIFPPNAYTLDELAEFSRQSMQPFADTRSDSERKAYAEEQAVKRKRNASRRQYEEIKSYLPNEAPKTFAAWQRMKATNSQKYRDLLEDYRKLRQLDNSKQINETKRKMSEQVLKLPQEQQDILREYSGALASRINYAKGAGKMTPELEEKEALLHKALSQGVMPEKTVLVRETCISFMNLNVKKETSENELKKLIGYINTNDIFTSTSFNALNLQGRDTRMYLTVPEGYKGCQYIKPVVYDKYKYQEEVLFDSPLTYRFTDVKIDETGKILLFAEVINNNGA